jgi:hypothetical protein
MAITSVAQAIQEINATNLVDGQQIKGLLADLSTFLGAGGTLTPQAGPAEMTSTTGGAAGAAFGAVAAGVSYAQGDITNLSNAVMSINAKFNALLTALVAAGVLTSV